MQKNVKQNNLSLSFHIMFPVEAWKQQIKHKCNGYIYYSCFTHGRSDDNKVLHRAKKRQ